jgi:hypothetical protein
MIAVGSAAHKERFCRQFVASHRPYDPDRLPWPELDAAASAAEAWLALRLAGAPLGFGPVLTIKGLLYAIRSVAFAVPNAVGVQEGAYILLGAEFGVTPDLALALSLLKRARDLVIGLPALAVWQWAETGHIWRRAGGATPPVVADPLPADALPAGFAAPPPPR